MNDYHILRLVTYIITKKSEHSVVNRNGYGHNYCHYGESTIRTQLIVKCVSAVMYFVLLWYIQENKSLKCSKVKAMPFIHSFIWQNVYWVSVTREVLCVCRAYSVNKTTVIPTLWRFSSHSIPITILSSRPYHYPYSAHENMEI